MSLVLFRYRKKTALLPPSLASLAAARLGFSSLSNDPFSLSLFLVCALPLFLYPSLSLFILPRLAFNDHGGFSRSSTARSPPFLPSEMPTLSNTALPKTRQQALIANDCFRRAQSHLETLTAIRFCAILWDKCLTRRIIKREAGSVRPDEAVFSGARFFAGAEVVGPRPYRISLPLR